MIFPIKNIKLLQVDAVTPYLSAAKGNYWYSIIGLAFLLVSIKFLISGITRTNRNNYIMRYTKLGQLKISSQTIVGLTENVVSTTEGISDVKVDVKFEEDSILLIIKGLVYPDVNIPEVTTGLQNKVKEHVEKCTGVEVKEVKVEVNNITAPVKVTR
ncbi:hypothetical protein L21TH_0197 [Caldisalinibacter kiritimatiensis]|uniref:Alkaline shock protein n=2 Tax=Caldisalinibacter kiritimatiensis TaxID=1304284 RepID=R1AYG0_9FIRM|nr:hypothetical protein L21TH_0197 [Caldisalinibacter kiritimatiensis]